MMQAAAEPGFAELLLVIDAQKAFMTGAHAVPDHRALGTALSSLIAKARAADAPVVFLQNNGSPGAPDEALQTGWELYFPAVDSEFVIQKSRDDGFDGTDLEERLKALRVRRIAICGLLSEMCVAATARVAMSRGYDIILPHDGHATYDVPPGPGGSEGVPARMAARAAEWSLGDEAVIVASVDDVHFRRKPG
jgi:nicotinamidase-related amidase